MTSNPQFIHILQRLLEKSKRNEVNWQCWENSHGKFRFVVVISEKTDIEILFHSPESEPDYIVASLLKDRNEVITLRSDDGDANYELMHELFEQAYRTTTKWDEVLQEVEQALAGDGPVGETAPF